MSSVLCVCIPGVVTGGVSSVLSDNNNVPPHHLHPVPAVPAGVPGGAALGDQPGAGHLLPRAVLGQGQTRQPG